MKRLVALIMLVAFFTPLMAQYTDADIEAYVEKYKDYANRKSKNRQLSKNNRKWLILQYLFGK